MMSFARILARKAFADLRRARHQSLAIILIVAASTAAVALALILWRGSADPWERVFAASNGPHAVFFSADATADLASIRTLDGISDTAGPFPMVWDHYLVRDGERENLLLLGFPAERPDVGRPLLADGRWLDAGGNQEIVLDAAFARNRGIRVGDQVDVEAGDGTIRLTVAGLSITTWRGPYPNWRPVAAYVSPATLQQIEPVDIQALFFVRLDDPGNAHAFVERTISRFPEGAICCTVDWQEVRDALRDFNSVTVLLLGALSLFALAAVAFVIANTIGGRVLTQRREIGLLKAAGFTPGQVTIMFLVEHLILGLIGGVIGLLAGSAAARLFLWQVARPYDTAPVTDFDPWLRLPILLGVLGLVALATVVPAWHAGRIRTAEALSPRRRAGTGRRSGLGQLAIRLRLPAVVIVGVKDVFTRPVRAWLAVAALALTVTTATFTLGMEATLQTYVDGPIWAANPPEITVRRDAVPDDETRQIIAAMPAITGFLSQFQISTKLADRARWLSIRAVGDDTDGVGLVIPEGRMFAARGEAMVGQGLLDVTGLAVGDDLSLLLNGEPLTLRIVGRYVEFDNDGQMALVGFDTVRSVLPDALPDEYALQLVPGTDTQALKVDLLSASAGRFGVRIEEPEPSRRETFELRLAVYSLNGVLIVIGLINLLTVALLGVRDRVRDHGLLKALGMTPRQMVLSEITGMALLALLAVAIGIPIGLFVGPALFDVIARNDGIGSGLATLPAWWWLAPLLPAAILIAALVAAIPAGIAARLPMTDALRAE